MRKSPLVVTTAAPLVLFFGLAGTTPAFAGSSHHASLEQCLKAAQSVRQGSFTTVEYLSMTQRGGPTYEIEIKDADGKSWEMMCSAADASVYEIETEFEHGDDPAFAEHAKISAEQAIDIAKKRFGGTPSELEYEIEFDGSPSYEIDLNENDNGDRQFKVEVDAATGKIIEVSVEQWQIGDESDENLGSNDESTNMEDSGGVDSNDDSSKDDSASGGSSS